MLKVSDIVKCDTAYLTRVQDGCLWYAIQSAWIGEEHFDPDWEFPVPLAELDGGIFSATEKPLLLMRWIRRQVAVHNENLRAKLRWETSEHGLRDTATLTDLTSCPRCGSAHSAVDAEVLKNSVPPAEYQYWYLCPITLQPVMVSVNEQETR